MEWKVIEEMAKYIEDNCLDNNICNKKNCFADEYVDGHCQKCINCIKDYFLRMC